MTAGYDKFPEVAGNLQNVRKSWGQMSRILTREGADPKVSGHFFKALVQSVLLLGSKMRVLTLRMERALSSFQHRVAQRINGRHPMRRGGGRW